MTQYVPVYLVNSTQLSVCLSVSVCVLGQACWSLLCSGDGFGSWSEGSSLKPVYYIITMEDLIESQKSSLV